jgi:energy-coupling factor transport system permease protein
MTMLSASAPDDRVSASLLGRTSPLVKLAVAVAWLIGLAFTLDVRPPIVLSACALAAGAILGAVPLGRLVRVLLPALVPLVAIVVANLLFSRSNADPLAVEIVRIGPLRLTEPALLASVGIGARIGAIVGVGAVFLLTTDTTRFVDALVQQARMPARFAYGANAAYQAVPNLAADLTTLRAARRLRGLRSWHPRLLVGLLVRAIRRADQLALAMDARAFGIGPRSAYREVKATWRDPAVLALGLAVLLLALRAGGTLGP